MWYPILLTAVISYLLGNLNGAVCISACVEHDDVRKHGSGNAGLTNFLRNYGGWSTLLVLALDMGKTALGCLLGGALLESWGYRLEGMMLGAVAVSLGHDFPALLQFRGGKGILSGFTVALVIDWRIALILLAVFLVCVLTTRYVSLGSVLGATAFAICFGVLYWMYPWVAAGGIFLGVLAVFMHRQNIKRLLTGTENRFIIKKKNGQQ